MYILDEKEKKPLHIQLYEAIKEDIISNYAIGEKLPSIRKVVTLYNLSKTTVESAYSQLYAEGYIESRPKSGYYVCEFYFDSYKKDKVIPHSKTDAPNKSYLYDFFPAQLHTEDFPLKLWKRISAKVLDQNVDFGAYPDGQGEYVLRDAIAKYLQNSRGVACDAKHIIITHGFGDSMELLAKLIQKRYRHFAQEIPGYHIAHKVFAAYGYDIHPIGVDENGLDIEQLKQSQAQIVYITPTHQYPTGATMPIANRLKLIQHMQSIDGLIIEDDYDSELSYHNRPIPSLQGVDRADHVVYLGTFAKALSPAVRVGYMVVPSWIRNLYKDSYDAHFARVSLSTQLTLAHFMTEGHWERHISRIRILNKKKHQTMKNALLKYLGSSCDIIAEGAGLAILIQPTNTFDYQKFKQLAEKAKIKIYLANERSGGDFEAVRMGFGGFALEEIKNAVKAFSKVWHPSFI
ncbi:PLP-dependent aminotransferase family protein [Sulfurovum sp. NBC37-1]|uniref:MocR-like pyridoxine biosynthesis transcription factor PdxR n=1 Tax=Sulfurovum sp. (strain NBC37-1) TaxID=387093 RepID=UPI000158768F|nr:PLP-dependent aminotransferase family protein [Sulfurovum sp. NBC37-1]BAF71880.1 transcriptional regulator, GntR family [Sulfurovum sp. NBC37-1]